METSHGVLATQATAAAIANDVSPRSPLRSGRSLAAPAQTTDLDARVADIERLVETTVDWLGYMTLWAAVASILIGGMVWGMGNVVGNGDGSRLGRRFVVAGMVGALLVPLAPAVVNAISAA